MKRQSLKLCVLVLAAALFAAACTSVFRTEPFVDASRDANGEVVLLDTPRMWEDWQQEVGRAISSEKAGRRPGGGIESWNEQWSRVIRANQSRENSWRYIDYIIQSRRLAGLPELTGLEPVSGGA